MRGAISQTNKRGTQVMQAWPRRRGAPKSPVTKEQNNLFAKLSVLQRNAMDEDKVGARDIAYASGYTWRDVLSRAAVGRLIIWGPNLSDDVQALLDTLCTNPGAMIVRLDDGWHCLFPGADNEVLTLDPTTHKPAWLPGAGSSARGLWSGAFSALPRLSNTGFTTWVAQGTSTWLENPNGLTLFKAATSGNDHWSLVTKPAPVAPYTVTALLAVTATGGGINGGLIGWHDNASKFQGCRLINNNGTFQLFVSNYTNENTFSANPIGPLSWFPTTMVWLRLNDNGTNITISISSDGINFDTIYTVAKASGFLGSAGYTKLCIGGEANARACWTSLMSYQETSP